MSYSYDFAGNLLTETYPSGRVVRNSFDGAGKLSAVSSRVATKPFKPYAQNFTYTAHGAVKQVQLGNMRWESTEFNARLQPTQIALGTTPQGTDLLKLNYSYGMTNNNGNVQSQTITVPGMSPLTQTYVYDALNRLWVAGETGGPDPWQQYFRYDRYGNRNFIAEGTNLPAVLNQTNNPTICLTTNRLDGYGYDLAGNVTVDAANHTFAYDAENHLVQYDGGSTQIGGAEYFYDGDGRRVKKIVGTVETLFVYNITGRLVAEYTLNSQPGNDGTSYLTSDTLGTPRVITGADGSVKARHDYLPFGEELDAGVGGRTTQQGYSVAEGVRQKFTSYERDSETDLDFAQARYYSNRQGRFTSVDPEQAGARNDNPQSWNGYSYALNNPILFVDPDGLAVEVTWSNSSKTYTDAEFEAYREDLQRQGFIVKGGNIYAPVMDDEGKVVGQRRIATYVSDCLYCEQLITGMAKRGPAMERFILGFTALNLAPAAGIVTSMTATGGGLTALNLVTRAVPAATASGSVLSQLSRTDASIFQKAIELGASAQNSFMNNLSIVRDALFQIAGPDKRITQIGSIGNSPVFGSVVSRIGIAEVNGVTVIVKVTHGNPQVLGPLK
jgi:RHS repeat-associated protein